jgi:hypothetical protein
MPGASFFDCAIRLASGEPAGCAGLWIAGRRVRLLFLPAAGTALLRRSLLIGATHSRSASRPASAFDFSQHPCWMPRQSLQPVHARKLKPTTKKAAGMITTPLRTRRPASRNGIGRRLISLCWTYS